ncbi:MAG: glycosyltransferase family 9 protein [Planctomycetes bacterium]|nr:glycosyltransferase family 9 protein [Planctomycetota bacterium]
MQIVEAMGDVRVLDSAGRFAYALRRGERYVLHDQETAPALRDGAAAWVSTLGATIRHYGGEPLGNHRLLLPFIGRLGDALVTGSCLAALQERFPCVRVDVACRDAARAVFELMPTFGELLPYPVPADRLTAYDFCLTFEDIESMPNAAARSCGDVFSECLRTPRPVHSVALNIPHAARRCWRLPPSTRPRVGLHVGRPDSLRTYPADRCRELARELADRGYEVHLFGEGRSSNEALSPSETDGSTFAHPLAAATTTGGVADHTGRTATVRDLAALLEQMHVVVTGDSFPLHLAGALRVPTVALFTSTDAVLASDYDSVVPLPSRAACSPCRVSEGACPLGYAECIAHRDSSLTPIVVARQVAKVLAQRATVDASLTE